MDRGHPPLKSRHVEKAPVRPDRPSARHHRVADSLPRNSMGFEGNAKLLQRSCPPILACSRWGDPTMPPHHVKVSGPRGLGGWGWGWERVLFVHYTRWTCLT